MTPGNVISGEDPGLSEASTKFGSGLRLWVRTMDSKWIWSNGWSRRVCLSCGGFRCE
jgi:hypothetical protein